MRYDTPSVVAGVSAPAVPALWVHRSRSHKDTRMGSAVIRLFEVRVWVDATDGEVKHASACRADFEPPTFELGEFFSKKNS
jgi:hypothetical protein